MSENKGILFFAENNSRINYLQLAILAAKCVKANMGESTKIAVVTTIDSEKWIDDKDTLKIFDHIIFQDPQDASNIRTYSDTQYYSIQDSFKNSSRSNAYLLSPFDETILMDVDYLVLNDSLNNIWGNAEDFLINNSAIGLNHKQLDGPEFRLNPYGIRMYWATLIYFKKTQKSRLIFELVDHIRTCWDYYKHVYDFAGTIFRNDFAFSIAIHMLSGFKDSGDFVKSFPNGDILTALELDQFISFDKKDSVRFFMNDRKENHKFYLTKIKGVNVHCLNKISLLNNMTKCLEAFNE